MAMKVCYTVVNGRVMSENRRGVERDYSLDPLGNARALYDNTQTKTDTFTYTPFGTVASRTGATPTPFQWNGGSGYFTDSSSRKHVRARNYFNGLGRWGSQDPIGFDGGDFNLYRYCGNRFVVMADPSGLLVNCTDKKKKCHLLTPAEANTPETVGCYECKGVCASCKDGQVDWKAVYSVALNQINAKNANGCLSVTPEPIVVIPSGNHPFSYTPTTAEILDVFAKVVGCLAGTESTYNTHCHGGGTTKPRIPGAWGILQQSVDSFRVCKEPSDPLQICDLVANVNSTVNMIISHATGRKKDVNRALRSEMESYRDAKQVTWDCMTQHSGTYSSGNIKSMMGMIQGAPCAGVSKKCF